MASLFVQVTCVLLSIVILTENVVSTVAWYVPGSPVSEYCSPPTTKALHEKDNDCKSKIPVSVNRLDSSRKYVPYDYTRFDFCDLPADSYVKENLGQVLEGDRLYKSPYDITFMKSENCSTVCHKTIKSGSLQWNYLKEAIDFNYQHHWYVDDLPVLWCYDANVLSYCLSIFPVGCHVTAAGNRMDACVILPAFKEPDTYYLFNHLDFVIWFNPVKQSDSKDSHQLHGNIVKVSVSPQSIDYSRTGKVDCKSPENQPAPLAISANFTEDINVTYTYSIRFQVEEDMSALNRWNIIINSQPISQISELSIMNSGLVITFLTGGLAILSYRIKASRNKKDDSMGWQMVREEVFRAPLGFLPLTVLVGSGIQVTVTMVVVLSLASLGTVSAANPGSIVTTSLISYVVLGSFPAGYITILLYKMWGGAYWKVTAAITAISLPALMLFQLFMANMILLSQQSAAVLPVTTWLALLAIWLLVNMPLVFLGGYAANKQKRTLHPVPPSEICMIVPKKTCGQKLGNAAMKVLCVILPFGCIYMQLLFVLRSLWSDGVYYSQGLLALSVVFLMVTCVELAILTCYLELNSQDYRWAWRSFIYNGSGAILLFLYSIYYYVTRLQAHDAVSGALYYGVTTVMVVSFFAFTGSLGFLASLYFVRKLYMPYAKDYYQKPMNVLVERELRNVSATEEILESIDQDEDEVNTESQPLLTDNDKEDTQ
ncbi:transmembrane 9 superfamily member 2-like [Ptychodera flava]|uniref:transmembrane 9 superfamily member 2-like n=1 Tax=Ptychodera flava TaxID=63121 RepID=UPI00396A886D